MRIIYLSIFFSYCHAADDCSIVDECNGDIAKRLSMLESEMETVKMENQELKTRIGTVEMENVELKNDVLELEKIVRPGKIPASCEEHRDRGARENGIYEIKPAMDIDPFYVNCDFRKYCQNFGRKLAFPAKSIR